MRGGPMQALAASPTMVGAVTTLIVIVAVFLAYNATQGLPFVPAYRVAVDVPNAARLTENNEVRIGGVRAGLVEQIEVVPQDEEHALATAPGANPSHDGAEETGTVARLHLKLDKEFEPLPEASLFRIRYRSSFGLKYVEVIRGGGPDAAEGHVFKPTDEYQRCGLPEGGAEDPANQAWYDALPEEARHGGCFQDQTEFDDINNTFNAPTRANSRANLIGYGDGFARRGIALNEAVHSLEPLFRNLRPVARILADPDTDLERFFGELGDAARIVAPVAREQADMFRYGARTFAAFTDDPEALRETISEGPPTLETGIRTLPAQVLFLDELAEFSRELRPGARDLRPTLPVLNDALEIGTPVLEASPETNRLLRRALRALERLVDQRATDVTIRRLADTFDTARPLARWVVPAQTVCNYWNYWFTFLPEALTDRDQIGNAFRQSLTRFPGAPAVRTPLGGYSGQGADGRAGAVGGGEFRPYSLPTQVNSRPYMPTGQRNADCQGGQFGYPLGQLRAAGQALSDPGIKVSNLPGSRGPTTLFYDADKERQLVDTRNPDRQPQAWRRARR